MDEINVSDISPAELLAALYNGAIPMGAGILQARDGDMTVEQAAKLISGEEVETDYPGRERTAEERKQRGVAYFDYLFGRPLKLQINGKTLRPWGYDRDHGKGAAQRIVNALRARKNAA